MFLEKNIELVKNIKKMRMDFLFDFKIKDDIFSICMSSFPNPRMGQLLSIFFLVVRQGPVSRLPQPLTGLEHV